MNCVGLAQAAARWEAHPLGANGGPKGEGVGTRAGRWGCRGLRTAKRAIHPDHYGPAYNTPSRPNPLTPITHHQHAPPFLMLLRVPPGCCCGRIHVRRLALGMWAFQVASCLLDCLSKRVLQPVAETIKGDVLLMFYLFSRNDLACNDLPSQRVHSSYEQCKALRA